MMGQGSCRRKRARWRRNPRGTLGYFSDGRHVRTGQPGAAGEVGPASRPTARDPLACLLTADPSRAANGHPRSSDGRGTTHSATRAEGRTGWRADERCVVFSEAIPRRGDHNGHPSTAYPAVPCCCCSQQNVLRVLPSQHRTACAACSCLALDCISSAIWQRVCSTPRAASHERSDHCGTGCFVGSLIVIGR